MKKEDFEKELKELEKLRITVEHSLMRAPKGRMRCEMARGKYPQYYVIDEKTRDMYPGGKYLRKEEAMIARDYAQKEYDSIMLKKIDKRIKSIKQLLVFEEVSDIRNVYENLPIPKRSLIEPYVLSDADYEQEWKNNSGTRENTYPIINGFETERGELVRSKSEKMIADKLLLRNVPYKYEVSLRLGKKNIVFPDFTILNRSTREELYLEHFGMMDSPEYCRGAIEKIEMYEENGIYLGERLFATFESSLKPINIKTIDDLIDRHLL